MLGKNLFTYTLNDTQIGEVESIRDIWVILDIKLNLILAPSDVFMKCGLYCHLLTVSSISMFRKCSYSKYSLQGYSFLRKKLTLSK